MPTPPGDVAVMVVPLLETLTLVAGVFPNVTVDPALNPAPLIVTCVPPVAGPKLGEMLVITGIKVNLPAVNWLVPLFTVTVTVPVPAGESIVIDVPEPLTIIEVAEVFPKSTVELFSKPEPVMVTGVPP